MAIAIYMRVSTIDNQDHAAQEAALKAWEKGQTGAMVWYKDSAGGMDTNRPGFKAMMRDVSRGKVTRTASEKGIGSRSHLRMKTIRM